MSLLFLEEMRAVDLRIRLASHLSFTSMCPSIHTSGLLCFHQVSLSLAVGHEWTRQQ